MGVEVRVEPSLTSSSKGGNFLAGLEFAGDVAGKKAEVGLPRARALLKCKPEFEKDISLNI